MRTSFDALGPWMDGHMAEAPAEAPSDDHAEEAGGQRYCMNGVSLKFEEAK